MVIHSCMVSAGSESTRASSHAGGDEADGMENGEHLLYVVVLLDGWQWHVVLVDITEEEESKQQLLWSICMCSSFLRLPTPTLVQYLCKTRKVQKHVLKKADVLLQAVDHRSSSLPALR
jgi:hypothetical protein